MFASYGTGSIFNKSIYDGILRLKNIPILKKAPPKKTRNILASVFMSKPVVTLNSLSSVDEVEKALNNHEFNGFPVVNKFGRLRGLISRATLYSMLEAKCWYDRKNVEAK